MYRFAAAFLLGLALLSKTASAQSEDAHRKAEQYVAILEKSVFDNPMVEQMLLMVRSQFLAELRKKNPNVQESTLNEISQMLADYLKEMSSEAMKASVPLFEKGFTVEELDALLAFYGSPVGQSINKKMPTIMIQQQTTMMMWMKGNLPGLVAKMEEKVKAKGLKI